ncbi:acyl-CoA thioesterase [Sphingoaurantiacus capsulatus]|uniref:Acyl-CoA thioesterase n=1 Tax=Sphingoaurantiacus capsulatus TaxID=1771310 RepID=A0ABV7XAZ3_9SPHN
MARADFRFAFRKRVRFAEIDAQSVVFNSRYLEYFDIGITEYWRTVGMYDNTPVSGEGAAEFHVARAIVDFKVPIMLDEEIDICARCSRIGTSSMTFAFELHGAAKDDLRATGEEVSVHVAEVRGKSSPVPDWVVALFETYEGRALRERKAA